jgi:hypothetical protein
MAIPTHGKRQESGPGPRPATIPARPARWVVAGPRIALLAFVAVLAFTLPPSVAAAVPGLMPAPAPPPTMDAAEPRSFFEALIPGQLATTGPDAHVRHPQDVGSAAIMLGFLVQWPALLTLTTFPVLVTIYVRLAHREEPDALAGFGQPYVCYAAATPALVPRLARPASKTA